MKFKNLYIVLISGLGVGVLCALAIPGMHPVSTLVLVMVCTGMGYGLAQYLNKNKSLISKEKEPQFLQTIQISQVFLFNTLHNISALFQVDPQKANRSLERLAEYVRAIMEVRREQFIYFGQELKCVELYMAVEKDRFNERFNVNYDIDPGCHEVKIPSLILQPLVDASIRFGVEIQEGVSQIDIKANCIQGNMVIELSDTGQSFDPQHKQNMKDREPLMKQIRDRLHSIYGNNAQFDAKAIVPAGCLVTLKIPIK